MYVQYTQFLLQKPSYASRPPPQPCLHLIFCSESPSDAPSTEEVRIYETAFSAVDAETARSKVASEASLDVCSPLFDAKRAADQIRLMGGNRIVADVLLDQKARLLNP